uniref:Phosphatidic acid phosphatase type 2/haloperoxidase domain-containing protein n=1 Tax=Meloidogyne javanica TaxID=6303 RepID=A0A915NEX0_MELJA
MEACIVGYHLRRFFPITLRGFFCQDFSIRFPYRDSTVETNTIFYVSIAILAVLVFVGEFFINKPRDPTNPEFWKLDLYTHIRVFSKSFGSFAAPILPLLIVLYSIIISLGSFVAVSRVFDHKHHPSDVAVGFCVGAAIAILSVFFHRNFFFSAREMKKKDVGKKNSNSVVEVNIISENTRV